MTLMNRILIGVRGSAGVPAPPPDVQSILSLAPDVYAALNHNQLPSGPTMWQDFDQNIPVTEPGQLVAAVKNLGSYGGFFVAEGGATRPEWTGDGLYFDGVDDSMQLLHPTMGDTLAGFAWATWFDPGDELDRTQRAVTDRGPNSPAILRNTNILNTLYGVPTTNSPTLTENDGEIRLVLEFERTESGSPTIVKVQYRGAVTADGTGSGSPRAHTADGTNLGCVRQVDQPATQHFTGLIRSIAGWNRDFDPDELSSLPITLGE